MDKKPLRTYGKNPTLKPLTLNYLDSTFDRVLKSVKPSEPSIAFSNSSSIFNTSSEVSFLNQPHSRKRKFESVDSNNISDAVASTSSTDDPQKDTDTTNEQIDNRHSSNLSSFHDETFTHHVFDEKNYKKLKVELTRSPQKSQKHEETFDNVIDSHPEDIFDEEKMEEDETDMPKANKRRKNVVKNKKVDEKNAETSKIKISKADKDSKLKECQVNLTQKNYADQNSKDSQTYLSEDNNKKFRFFVSKNSSDENIHQKSNDQEVDYSTNSSDNSAEKKSNSKKSAKTLKRSRKTAPAKRKKLTKPAKNPIDKKTIEEAKEEDKVEIVLKECAVELTHTKSPDKNLSESNKKLTSEVDNNSFDSYQERIPEFDENVDKLSSLSSDDTFTYHLKVVEELKTCSVILTKVDLTGHSILSSKGENDQINLENSSTANEENGGEKKKEDDVNEQNDQMMKKDSDKEQNDNQKTKKSSKVEQKDDRRTRKGSTKEQNDNQKIKTGSDEQKNYKRVKRGSIEEQNDNEVIKEGSDGDRNTKIGSKEERNDDKRGKRGLVEEQNDDKRTRKSSTKEQSNNKRTRKGSNKEQNDDQKIKTGPEEQKNYKRVKRGLIKKENDDEIINEGSHGKQNDDEKTKKGSKKDRNDDKRAKRGSIEDKNDEISKKGSKEDQNDDKRTKRGSIKEQNDDKATKKGLSKKQNDEKPTNKKTDEIKEGKAEEDVDISKSMPPTKKPKKNTKQTKKNDIKTKLPKSSIDIKECSVKLIKLDFSSKNSNILETEFGVETIDNQPPEKNPRRKPAKTTEKPKKQENPRKKKTETEDDLKIIKDCQVILPRSDKFGETRQQQVEKDKNVNEKTEKSTENKNLGAENKKSPKKSVDAPMSILSPNYKSDYLQKMPLEIQSRFPQQIRTEKTQNIPKKLEFSDNTNESEGEPEKSVSSPTNNLSPNHKSDYLGKTPLEVQIRLPKVMKPEEPRNSTENPEFLAKPKEQLASKPMKTLPLLHKTNFLCSTPLESRFKPVGNLTALSPIVFDMKKSLPKAPMVMLNPLNTILLNSDGGVVEPTEVSKKIEFPSSEAPKIAKKRGKSRSPEKKLASGLKPKKSADFDENDDNYRNSGVKTDNYQNSDAKNSVTMEIDDNDGDLTFQLNPKTSETNLNDSNVTEKLKTPSKSLPKNETSNLSKISEHSEADFDDSMFTYHTDFRRNRNKIGLTISLTDSSTKDIFDDKSERKNYHSQPNNSEKDIFSETQLKEPETSMNIENNPRVETEKEQRQKSAGLSQVSIKINDQTANSYGSSSDELEDLTWHLDNKKKKKKGRRKSDTFRSENKTDFLENDSRNNVETDEESLKLMLSSSSSMEKDTDDDYSSLIFEDANSETENMAESPSLEENPERLETSHEKKSESSDNLLLQESNDQRRSRSVGKTDQEIINHENPNDGAKSLSGNKTIVFEDNSSKGGLIEENEDKNGDESMNGLINHLKNPAMITMRRGKWKNRDFGPKPSLNMITEDNATLENVEINEKIVEENKARKKSKSSKLSVKFQPIVEDLEAINGSTDKTDDSMMSGSLSRQQTEADKVLYLKPGKSWARSLSILNHIHNEDDVEYLSMGKGKKWRQSVISVLSMQHQGLTANTLKPPTTIGINDKTFNATSPARFNDSKNVSALSTSTGAVRRFASRMSVIPYNQKNNQINAKGVFDKSFHEVYGITSVPEDSSSTNKRASSRNVKSSARASIRETSGKDRNSRSVAETNPKEPTISAKNVVLDRCNQTDFLSFSECYPDSYIKHCRKIGEGVYGEVFLYNYQKVKSVIKIIPIEGTTLVNGEPQKKFDEILSEIIIAKELHNLRINEPYSTNGFCEVKNIRCIMGKYPDKLLELWQLYDEEKNSENDCPSMFDDSQLYISLELGDGGQDMESFVFNNATETYSTFLQTVLTLAVGEKSLSFEHRDMHWGNILISRTNDKTVSYKLGNEEITMASNGVKVTIIDFTLSRMSYQECCIFNNLALDPELFNAVGEYQFEIYRLMREKTGNNWHLFEPYTNILWLHYILDKMIKGVRYQRKTSNIHKNTLQTLQDLKDIILDYDSAFDLIENCDKLKNLQRKRAGG